MSIRGWYLWFVVESQDVDTPFDNEINDFILFLATERGLSENYQLSTRRSLEEFAVWYGRQGEAPAISKVTTDQLTTYCCGKKTRGVSSQASLEPDCGGFEDFFPLFEGPPVDCS